jgi:hypothetical protein
MALYVTHYLCLLCNLRGLKILLVNDGSMKVDCNEDYQ